LSTSYTTKKVSVCIPSYNAGKFIGETIKSVLDSAYQDFEIVVNDDASTDNTREIVESFEDSRIKFYQNQENVGAIKNWNLAIKKATGEYVGLLNHDDLYGPFWLTLAVYQMEKHPQIGWAATAHRVIDVRGHTLNIISRFAITGEISKIDAFIELAKLNGLGPGFIARRHILEEIGYFDENAGYGADNDLFLRLAVRYPLFYCASYPHTSWRLHNDNLTNRWNPVDQVRECIRILEKVFSDDTLPAELRQFEAACCALVYNKTIAYAEDFLRRNDNITYSQIIAVLKLNKSNCVGAPRCKQAGHARRRRMKVESGYSDPNLS